MAWTQEQSANEAALDLVSRHPSLVVGKSCGALNQ